MAGGPEPGHAEFAFDLAALDHPEGRTLRTSRLQHVVGRTSASDSHSWEQPVHAPIGGTVARARGDRPDRHRLHLVRDVWRLITLPGARMSEDLGRSAGNHLILQGAGFYVLLAHLREESVRVREGDRVEAGEVVGRIGNSGASLEPHLHFQLLDRIDDLSAAGVPAFVVACYERWTGTAWERIENKALRRGHRYRTQPARAARRLAVGLRRAVRAPVLWERRTRH